jgi:hypothetical protein
MDSDDSLSGSSLFETDSDDHSAASALSPSHPSDLQFQEIVTDAVDRGSSSGSLSAMDRRVRRRQHEQEQPDRPNDSVAVGSSETASAAQVPCSSQRFVAIALALMSLFCAQVARRSPNHSNEIRGRRSRQTIKGIW